MRQTRFKFFSTITLMIFLVLSSNVYADDLPDFTKLANKTAKAVVNISTLKKARKSSGNMPQQFLEEFEGTPFYDMFRHFWGQLDPNAPGQDVRSLGSGFIIDDSGYIVTNTHVINEADEIIVRLNDRRELPAKVVGQDPDSDIALLKIDADDLPSLELANSRELEVGEWVVAIGSPFGFDHSVTAGIVSAKGRSFGQERYVPFIQTDVAINPGNSGGPLLNMDGEVVGVNSHIVTRSGQFGGLSFAIPSNVVKNIVKQIREHGKVTRGWLGLMFQEVNRELAESFGLDKPRGALIAKVLDDSPAAKAGLKRGDVILKFNDIELNQASELPPLVGQLKPGSEIKLEVFRDRRKRNIKVKIGSAPDNATAETEAKTESKASNIIGAEVRELSSAERARMDADLAGVVVTRIAKPELGRAGVKVGDVIMAINNQSIKTIADFNKSLKQLKAGQTVPILIYRQGMGQRFIALKL